MRKQKLMTAGVSLMFALAMVGCGGTTTTTTTVDTGNANNAAARISPTTIPATNTSATGAPVVRVADITGNLDNYLGRTVTVEADVEEVLSPFAFELDEDSPLAGGIDNDLLVFSRKSAGLADIDDQWLNNKVRVTGTVGRMSVVEIERETGWDLNPKLEAELEQVRPVIIAQSVERTGRN